MGYVPVKEYREATVKEVFKRFPFPHRILFYWIQNRDWAKRWNLCDSRYRTMQSKWKRLCYKMSVFRFAFLYDTGRAIPGVDFVDS